jgi:hypothetical protein
LLAKKIPEVFITYSSIHRYNTRRATQLHVPQTSYTLSSKSPYYSSIKILNSLPRRITEEPNINKFKENIKDFLCEAAYYSVEKLFDEA